jgi:two-component system, OmpR family, sensor histidine kinase MtrB
VRTAAQLEGGVVTLQRTVTIVTTAIAALALSTAVTLIVLTSTLNQLSSRLGIAVERVRVLMELESSALQSTRQGERFDTGTMADIIGRLQHPSDDAFSRDTQRLAGMIESADRAPTLPARRAELDAAIDLLREVVAREDLEARRATALAGSWNRVANRVGVAMSLLFVGCVTSLIWFGRRALQPLVGIADAIERFAAGDRAVRAPQVGPAELRRVAASFNKMATALHRQHERQLAFVGGVAHDLRNPLNALKMAGSLLQRQPHDTMRIGERVTRQVQHLEQMVDDLLDRTHIEAGRLELRLDVHDLRNILANVLDEQRDRHPTRVFRSVLPDRAVDVRCDMVRMEQVLHNLLSNAVKYSAESTDIEVRLEQNDSSAIMSVRDHGIGLTARDREHVFQPFMRGENVGGIGGAGLGLSVTKKIVDAHGGQIEVLSSPDSGTTFVVRLALAASDTRAARSSGTDTHSWPADACLTPPGANVSLHETSQAVESARNRHH